jgi:hypothetical protein
MRAGAKAASDVDALEIVFDRLALTEKAAESILFRARQEFRDGLGRVGGEDFSFPMIKNGKRCSDGQLKVLGRFAGDAPVEIETPRSADFDELKQRRS